MGTPPPFVTALQNPRCYQHPVERVALVETHISWVLLTGEFAYKIKKPLDLGFLDFATLEKRKHYCEEELRLNRRLAPQIYLAVLPITGSPDAPRVNGPGEAFEFCVKMRQFPQEAQLDRVLARGALGPEHMDELARTLAEFHGRVAVAGPDSPFGTPERVYQPMDENFRQIRPRIAQTHHPQLERLRAWSERTRDRRWPLLQARKRNGFLRECHGDAHLANMALLNDGIVLFDCLEFNENLRWIDVMNEVAFLVMDLDDRARPDLGRRVLNGYLEHTGDYEGLRLLRFYQVYRALVRAKVAAIRLNQPGLSEEEKNLGLEQYQGYADLAERYTQASSPRLLITHGVSGTGKTWLTQRLVEAMDAVRLRSDIERKRLHGLGPEARSGSALEGGLYTADITRQTYERLARLARAVLESGLSAIVDATFLKRWQRERLRATAQAARAPFVILDLQAPEAVLRERIAARTALGHDASEADLKVLERQMTSREPFGPDETACTVTINTHPSPEIGTILSFLQRFQY